MKANFRPIPQLFKDSFNMIGQVWLKYLGIYLITIVAFIAIIALAFGGVLASIAAENVTPDAIWASLGVTALLGLLAAIFVGNWLSLAGYKIIYGTAEGEEVSLGGALTYGLKNFASYLLVGIVSGLVIVLGLLALVIPGIYLAVILSMVSIVFVVEKRHNLGALSRSMELVRGNFWPVLGRMALLVLVTMVISFIASSFPDDIENLLALIYNFLLTPFWALYIYYIYKDIAASTPQSPAPQA